MAVVRSMVSLPRVLFDAVYLHPIPGTEYLDAVTIAPGVTIPQQYIGVASNAVGIKHIDGILGRVKLLPYVSESLLTLFPIVLGPVT